MGLDEIVGLIVQNGLGVLCVAYLIYFQHTTMTKMLDTMGSIDKRLAIIESKVDINEKLD